MCPSRCSGNSSLDLLIAAVTLGPHERALLVTLRLSWFLPISALPLEYSSVSLDNKNHLLALTPEDSFVGSHVTEALDCAIAVLTSQLPACLKRLRFVMLSQDMTSGVCQMNKRCRVTTSAQRRDDNTRDNVSWFKSCKASLYVVLW